MTNICNNRLTVTGNDLSGFIKWLEKTGLSLEKIISPPAEVENETKIPGAFSEKFQWRLDNWGTKYDIVDGSQEFEDSDKNVVVTFDTLWTPPVQAINHLSQKFPELTFSLKYCRIEEWFTGSAIAHNGELSNNRFLDPKNKNFVDIAASFGYSTDAELEKAA